MCEMKITLLCAELDSLLLLRDVHFLDFCIGSDKLEMQEVGSGFSWFL